MINSTGSMDPRGSNVRRIVIRSWRVGVLLWACCSSVEVVLCTEPTSDGSGTVNPHITYIKTPPIEDLRVANSGKLIVASCDDGTSRVFRFDGLQLVEVALHKDAFDQGEVVAVASSRNGRRIVSCAGIFPMGNRSANESELIVTLRENDKVLWTRRRTACMRGRRPHVIYDETLDSVVVAYSVALPYVFNGNREFHDPRSLVEVFPAEEPENSRTVPVPTTAIRGIAEGPNGALVVGGLDLCWVAYGLPAPEKIQSIISAEGSTASAIGFSPGGDRFFIHLSENPRATDQNNGQILGFEVQTHRLSFFWRCEAQTVVNDAALSRDGRLLLSMERTRWDSEAQDYRDHTNIIEIIDPKERRSMKRAVIKDPADSVRFAGDDRFIVTSSPNLKGLRVYAVEDLPDGIN